MTQARDRLGKMAERPRGSDQHEQSLQSDKGRPSSQIVLYVPPPSRALPYLKVLEHEGAEVLLAQTPETVERLLRHSRPWLIVALVPVLTPELEQQWAALAPQAEIRQVESVSQLLEERLAAPQALLEFVIKTLDAVAGLLARAQDRDQERLPRALNAARTAADILQMPWREKVAVELGTLLRQLSELALSAEDQDQESGTRLVSATDDPSALVEEFARLVACPVPLSSRAEEGPERVRPSPVQVVEAVFALVDEQHNPRGDTATTLRRMTKPSSRTQRKPLDREAVEAVLGAVQTSDERRKAEVLVVDPDVSQQSLVCLRLVNEGYHVRVARDGRSALEEIRERPPTVVVTETVLPGMDGFALLDALLAESSSMPLFLFYSTRSDDLSVNKGLLLGADDFIAKSTGIEVLLTKLDRLVREGESPHQATARISLSEISHDTPEDVVSIQYDELVPGVLIRSRFRIECLLGEGGMGKVFRARDERLEETVVIKVMKSGIADDPRVLNRFKREIRHARRITHPSVVRIFDFWEAGVLKFVTMEHLDGTDLKNSLKKRGRFPVAVTLRVGQELLDALIAAHNEGVIHRDIKPHNIFLLPNGRIKVLDFGISQGLDLTDSTVATLSGAGAVAGTPEYMSPEQLIGEQVDVRTDLYSAGIVLYEMITGSLPFVGKDRLTVAMQRIHVKPAPLSKVVPDLPGQVEEFVLRLLETDRDRRFATAKDAHVELQVLRSMYDGE